MSEETNVRGSVYLPGGWRKTIDHTSKVVKAFADKFEGDTEITEVATITERLQKAFDAQIVEGEKYSTNDFEKFFDIAEDKVAEDLKLEIK